jgi:hypothetical protein
MAVQEIQTYFWQTGWNKAKIKNSKVKMDGGRK